MVGGGSICSDCSWWGWVRRSGTDVQQIHVESEIEVGVCDVLAVVNVLYVPGLTVERFAKFAETIGEGSELAGFVGRFGVWDTGDEDQAVFQQLVNGREQAGG